jgi:tripartite-type tricarboxylate transporter receptor subunit TctC
MKKINDDVAAILKDSATRRSFSGIGATPMQTTPEQFKALFNSDVKKWAVVMKESGATAD